MSLCPSIWRLKYCFSENFENVLNEWPLWLTKVEAYLGPTQTSKIESFIAKIGIAIEDVWQSPKDASVMLIFYYLTDAYLEPIRISAIELFCKNKWRLKALNYFRKIAPS